MRLGNLLLLAGAALAANAWMNKTEKGRQLKRDLTDNAGKLTDRVKDTVSRYTSRTGPDDTLSNDLTGNPSGSPL